MPQPSILDGKDVHDRYSVIKSGKAGADYYGYYKDLQGFVETSFKKL